VEATHEHLFAPIPTNITAAVLTVAHSDLCTTSECRSTPDWSHTRLLLHPATLLDADGLLVEVAQGETVSPQGGVVERDPIGPTTGDVA
jgi:hypothetical protein